MKIGGWQKVSLVDYPEKICTTLFTQGCNFRCPYCHNPELVDPALFEPCLPEKTIFSLLEKRRGKLDAVCISGGEPTLQPDLQAFVRRVKEMGYLVKLDTNGSHPRLLTEMIREGLLDYIAMDIKGPLERYNHIVRQPIAPEEVAKSIQIIMDAGVAYEFRTTVVASLVANGDFQAMGQMIEGANLYILQRYVPSKPLDKTFLEAHPPSEETLKAAKKLLQQHVRTIIIR